MLNKSVFSRALQSYPLGFRAGAALNGLCSRDASGEHLAQSQARVAAAGLVKADVADHGLLKVAVDAAGPDQVLYFLDLARLEGGHVLGDFLAVRLEHSRRAQIRIGLEVAPYFDGSVINSSGVARKGEILTIAPGRSGTSLASF